MRHRQGYKLRLPHSITGLVVLIAAMIVLAVTRVVKLPTSAAPLSEGTVARVYDGDTVEVRGCGKVRLLGIDTLDGYNANRMHEQAAHLGLSEKQVKRWAQEATERVRELIEGKRVTLEFGPELKDDYGRTLAYVYLPGESERTHVNRLLVAEGLATATRKWKHPYRDEFIELEQEAKRSKLGLWKEARRMTDD